MKVWYFCFFLILFFNQIKCSLVTEKKNLEFSTKKNSTKKIQGKEKEISQKEKNPTTNSLKKNLNQKQDNEILKIFNITKMTNEEKNKQKEENFFKISAIESFIKISQKFSYGIVKDNIKFEIPQGNFKKILRKISIGGTSNKLHSFQITSR